MVRRQPGTQGRECAHAPRPGVYLPRVRDPGGCAAGDESRFWELVASAAAGASCPPAPPARSPRRYAILPASLWCQRQPQRRSGRRRIVSQASLESAVSIHYPVPRRAPSAGQRHRCSLRDQLPISHCLEAISRNTGICATLVNLLEKPASH